MTTDRNVYQAIFDRIDAVILELGADGAPSERVVEEAGDLLKRLAYVVANLLNVQAQTFHVLILPEPGSAPPAEASPEREVGDAGDPEQAILTGT